MLYYYDYYIMILKNMKIKPLTNLKQAKKREKMQKKDVDFEKAYIVK